MNAKSTNKNQPIVVPELLPPTSDFIFKALFGDRRSLDLTADFLQSFLKLPPESYGQLTLADPHLRRDRQRAKLGILDLKLLTTNGDAIDIEMQAANQKALRERAVFYAAKLLSEQLPSGENYSALRRAISVFIVASPLITESQAYHNRYRLCDPRTGSQFSDLLEIDVLELGKLPAGAQGSLANWLRFLKARNRKELTMPAKSNPKIAKAANRLVELSANEKMRQLYEMREKARRDEAARFAFQLDEALLKARRDEAARFAFQLDEALLKARRDEEARFAFQLDEALLKERQAAEAKAALRENKGRQEGLKQGLQQNRMENARRALRENIPPQMVAKFTSLPLKTVKALAAELAAVETR